MRSSSGENSCWAPPVVGAGVPVRAMTLTPLMVNAVWVEKATLRVALSMVTLAVVTFDVC